LWILLTREYNGEVTVPHVDLHAAGGRMEYKKTKLAKVYVPDTWRGRHFNFRYLKGKSVKNTMRTIKEVHKRLATVEEMARRRRRKSRKWEKEERVNVNLILDLLIKFGEQFPEGDWTFSTREG